MAPAPTNTTKDIFPTAKLVIITNDNCECPTATYDITINFDETANPSYKNYELTQVQSLSYLIDTLSDAEYNNCPPCVKPTPKTTKVTDEASFFAALATNSTARTNIVSLSNSVGGNTISNGMTVRVNIPLPKINVCNADPTEEIIFILYFSDNTSNSTPTSQISNAIPVFYPPSQPTILRALIAPFKEEDKLWLLIPSSAINLAMSVLTYYTTNPDNTSTNIKVNLSTPYKTTVCESGIFGIFIVDIPDDFNFDRASEAFIAAFSVREYSYKLPTAPFYSKSVYAKSHLSVTVGIEYADSCTYLTPELLSLDYLIYKTKACLPRCVTGCERNFNQQIKVTWEAPCDFYIDGNIVDNYVINYAVYSMGSDTPRCSGEIPTSKVSPDPCAQVNINALNTLCTPLSWLVDLEKDIKDCTLTCGDEIYFSVTANYLNQEPRISNELWESYFEFPEAPTIRLISVNTGGSYGESAVVQYNFWNPKTDGCYDTSVSPVWTWSVNKYEKCETLTDGLIEYVDGKDAYNPSSISVDFNSYTNENPITYQIKLKVKPPNGDPGVGVTHPEFVYGYPSILYLVPDSEILPSAFDEQRQGNYLYFTTVVNTPLTYAKVIKNGVEENVKLPDPILDDGNFKYYIEHNVGTYHPTDKKIKVAIKSNGFEEKHFKWPWH